jgi:hypothetical protein
LSRRQKAVNRSHARIRALGETRHRHPQDLEIPAQAAVLPRRATAIVQAILVLHHVEANRYPR